MASISKQVGMIVFTLLAHEFLLLKAIGDLSCAVALTELLQERAKSMEQSGVGFIPSSLIWAVLLFSSRKLPPTRESKRLPHRSS
jgi:hypothetical protein